MEDIDAAEKGRLGAGLVLASMSSDSEDDTTGQANRVSKPLPWESPELKALKKKVDKFHTDGLTPLQLRLTIPMRKGDTPSDRTRPSGKSLPDWAVIPLD